MTVPVSHLDESLKIEGKKPIDLWEIILRVSGAHIYLRDGQACTWQGHAYEPCAITLTGEGDYADEKNARPTLTLVDKNDVFGPFASAGYLDLATVIRRRVLQAHVNSNANIFEPRMWLIGRPIGVGDQQLSVELRSASDMPNWTIPPRSFTPPDFPYISY